MDQSFSSIVGPNGSGKSNTIDALLFVFGYRASKMRQGKLSELIHNSARYPDLDECSVEERMSWAAGRTTTLKEDKVYCLLGIFGVYLPLIYGEGEEYATARLKDEINRRQQRHGTTDLHHVAGAYFSIEALPFSVGVPC